MRTVFMGTPDFACPSLSALIESRHDIVGVITQPDRRRGRGMKISFSPVKELALGNDLNIYQPADINAPEFIGLLEKISPDLIVIVAFGQILSKEILELPKYGCINLHASLLPKYRGAAPIPWTILAGEEETGVTTFYLSEEVDSGDIILQREEKIREDDTAATLSKRLAEIGAELLIESIDKIERKEAPRFPQDRERATYAPRLKKEDGLIDWEKPASQIERLVRAMDPWPGAYTYLEEKLLKIWGAKELPITNYQRPGEIAKITKEGMIVACGEGFLLIKEVQPPGKKRMSASSFASGYRIKIGTILGSK